MGLKSEAGKTAVRTVGSGCKPEEREREREEEEEEEEEEIFVSNSNAEFSSIYLFCLWLFSPFFLRAH